MKRTYNQNKSLYESIMRDVAKSVKRQINEADYSEFSSNERTFFIINGYNEKDRALFSIHYNSINELYLIYYIILTATTSNFPDSFFKIESNSVDFKKNFKKFFKTTINNFPDGILDEIDDTVEKVCKECIDQKENSSDVATSIESILPSLFDLISSLNTNDYKLNTDDYKANMPKSSLYKKCFANVKDQIASHSYNKQWATETMPLKKYTDEELIYRYSAALILFNLEKPNNIQDVIDMGVFKNYIFEYINRNMQSMFENLSI